MKTKVHYENCTIRVESMEIVCPLCKVLVKSGEQHTCSKPLEVRPKPPAKRSSR